MDFKALKKTALLAIAGIVFLILYFLIPSLGLHPMIETLIRKPIAVLAAAPLIGAGVTVGVIGLRYLLVVNKAIERDKDYTSHNKEKNPPSSKKTKKQAKAEKEAADTRTLEQAEHWNYLWDLWAKGETESPVSDLLHYYSEVNNGGHAQYLDNGIEGEELERTVYEAFSLLPSPLKENLARAFAAKNEEFDDLSLDSALDACDHIFHENEELWNKVIQDIADELWAKKDEKSN